MAKIFQPTVSIVIPTLNAADILKRCLKFVAKQRYPQSKIEIIIADGGSTDDTVAVAKKFQARVLPNPLKTAEAGKAVGVKAARGELICLLDSDNFIENERWLERLVAPLADSDIIGAEPLYFTHRRGDGALTRYTALLGMGDPLVYFLGNYDHFCVLSGRWTALRIPYEDKGDWLKLSLRPHLVPTIGANGTVLRRSFLTKAKIGDYLFDIDLIAAAVDRHPLSFAKVKVGLVHIFGGDLSTFARKQRRRIKDFMYYQRSGLRTYPWSDLNKFGLVRFVVYTVLVLPTVGQAIIGYFKKPDTAWFLHPLACLITLWVYGSERLLVLIRPPQIASRANWQQTK